ncbi:isocitrate lyase/PEP mutase family protein [Pseudoalteromonas sp. T1lg23B]|uniref:isocitrate lyase/PEP mutase family protein n=1 Tax=Pseudoalteromonas sp. T1lg23B TaxID=2077097 RepID=UPI001319C729|nr:isocitrate lyase/phosphoenolpyruvate mutase family protein [Pseudoalteromonas sp. T1lg23B]
MSKYQHFHHLHNQPTIFKLLNAWDPLSAMLLEQAGCKAIATTSWGMANARGQRDGESCSFNRFLAQTKQLIDAVEIGVSVDIESGFSDDAITVCEHVLEIAKLGAVGINIEDSSKETGQLRHIDEQTKILSAIKQTLNTTGYSELFVNARIDTALLSEHHFSATLERAQAYVNAGVDGIFIPGLSNHSLIETLCKQLSVPVNILALADCCNSKELQNLGVKRLSFGNAFSDNCIDLIQKQVHKALNCSDHSDLFQYNSITLPF